jgi:hypothetical protein
MDRKEALQDYKNNIQPQLEQAEHQLEEHYLNLKKEFQVKLREEIVCLCKSIDRAVKYFQISLLRSPMSYNRFQIMLSAHDEEYFLDDKAVSIIFDVSEIFLPLMELKETIYGEFSFYMGKVQKFDADKLIIHMAMSFFKKQANDFRWYFQDFSKWDCIMELPKSIRLVVKWGEYREYSETVFLTSTQPGVQQQFVESNQNNSLEIWDSKYVYQSLDHMKIQGLVMEKKNVMFLGMRYAQMEQSVWNVCMLYGAGFRESVMEQVTFVGCDLSRSDFKNTVLRDVRFVKCQLSEADFCGVSLENVSFEDCEMEQALFSRQDLAYAGLSTRQLQQVRTREEPYVFYNGRG